MSVIAITQSNLDQILRSNKTVLIDFWAPWCAPCRMLSPVIDEIAEENRGIKVGKINVDEQGKLAERFQVTSIPMLVVVKNGKISAQSVGLQSKSEILNMVK